MSADDGGIRATQDKERARETPGHGHSCQEMLSESEGTVPVGEAHIKMEPEETQPDGVSQEARAQGARGWVPLSQGAQEKLFPAWRNPPGPPDACALLRGEDQRPANGCSTPHRLVPDAGDP